MKDPDCERHAHLMSDGHCTCTPDESAPASCSAKPMIHELKTDPEVFDAVAAGLKTFEIRKDDRGFEVGDTLLLQRTRHTGEEMAGGKPLVYTGHAITRTVSHLLRGPIYGLREGWVILSLNAELSDRQKDSPNQSTPAPGRSASC